MYFSEIWGKERKIINWQHFTFFVQNILDFPLKVMYLMKKKISFKRGKKIIFRENKHPCLTAEREKLI